ncbi:MAG: hypothetical protein NZ699_00595 [Roseiflexus sp.]|nr:hypothetical protein [Roseiflexus sp.]MCS7287608.1 hypothetical protein [Roseiflexus sp.]MDW8233645.1 hypothetical protein [Roseiflexaceae bacterium]
MLSVQRLLFVTLLGAIVTPFLPVNQTHAEETRPSPTSDAPVATLPVAPTYRVFATRQGRVGRRTANGHIIQPRDRFVALPSWSVLSSRGGREYQVRVTYRNRSVVLPVWDVGPWNTRDDYWSPNRRYSDLPVGLPMAQAARQHGYNNGRDEFGRRIRQPNGIDIADGAFWDDLGMTDSDWVEVTFLWLGADPFLATGSDASAGNDRTAIKPGAIVVDDGAAGYRATDGRSWQRADCGFGGSHVWSYDTPQATTRSLHRAVWSPHLPGEGFYEVMAFIPTCGPTPTDRARYLVTHSGAVSEIVVDQAAASGGWVSLGVFHMGPGSQVTLTNQTGADGRAVHFDALKWVPHNDQTPPDASVTGAALLPEGGILVRWDGQDDVSGIASFDVQVRRMPDGEWIDWRIRATEREAIFVPSAPGTYAFRARARDWTGKEQPWPDLDDIQIVVP